jgi:hypothetical protein
MNKFSAVESAKPVRRYEREHSRGLIRLDIKKLGRIGSVGHRITRAIADGQPAARHRLEEGQNPNSRIRLFEDNLLRFHN